MTNSANNKRLLFITVGTVANNAGSTRIISLARAIKKSLKIKIEIISQFPGRDSIISNENEADFKITYLSFYLKRSTSFVARLLKVLVGHVRLFFYIIFKTHKNDTLYFYCPMVLTTIPALWLAHLLNRKTVTDIVELFQHEKNTWYNRLGDKWAFKYATIPCAISDRLIEYGKKQTNKKIVKLPIVVDFERFDKVVVPKKYTVGYIGSSAAKDGLETILKAFRLVLQYNPLLVLKIRGPKPKKIHDILINECSSHIYWIPTLAENEASDFLLSCDTFIMNRDNALFAQYGYPTKLGEYFACNRPVLMSDGLGFSEDFTDKVEAIKYEVNNPQALAEAIKWRYENESKAQIIAQKGYDYGKKHFSNEVVGEIFVNRLKNL